MQSVAQDARNCMCATKCPRHYGENIATIMPFFFFLPPTERGRVEKCLFIAQICRHQQPFFSYQQQQPNSSRFGIFFFSFCDDDALEKSVSPLPCAIYDRNRNALFLFALFICYLDVRALKPFVNFNCSVQGLGSKTILHNE